MESRFKRRNPSGKFIVYRMDCQENGKSYIGITANLVHRLAQHWNEAKNGKETFLYRTIRKYGKQCFIVSEIDRAKTWDEVCEKEQYYIKLFKTKTPDGMNLTDGGEGNFGAVVSEETRQKQSKAHIGLNVGEKSTSAKLTNSKVIDIRRQYKKGGVSYQQLAKKFNVDKGTIHGIVRGKTWTYLSDNILTLEEVKKRSSVSHEKTFRIGEDHNCAKLTEQDVIVIRKRYRKEIISTPQLAKEYGVTKEAISNIISGRSWTHIQEGILSSLGIKKRQSQFRKYTYIGELGCNHKLTEKDVIFIRKECKRKSKSYRQFADKYNVHPDTISNIINRRTWTHI